MAVGASFWIGREIGRRGSLEPVGGPDTVTVTKWLHDTIKIAREKPAGSVAASLPLIQSEKEEIDPPPGVYSDTISQNKPDSALVEVPIVEREYEGENYRAVVRGFQPELVDIWIRQKETTITIPYRRRWSVTVGPQVGVGITPEGWRPYAGIGATFGYSF